MLTSFLVSGDRGKMRFRSAREIDYLVIKALDGGEAKTTLDLMDATGFNIATVYCSLNRLQKRELVSSEFDNASASENIFGARRKRYYLSF